MGGSDMYCDVCGAPFTPYEPKYYPVMNNVDTTWLNDAVIEFYNKQKVYVCYYDGYGRFEDKQGNEYDVIEKHYNKEVKIYHTICQSNQKSHDLLKYQQQYFDIERLIKDGKKHLLDKSYIRN